MKAKKHELIQEEVKDGTFVLKRLQRIHLIWCNVSRLLRILYIIELCLRTPRTLTFSSILAYCWCLKGPARRVGSFWTQFKNAMLPSISYFIILVPVQPACHVDSELWHCLLSSRTLSTGGGEDCAGLKRRKSSTMLNVTVIHASCCLLAICLAPVTLLRAWQILARDSYRGATSRDST